MKDTDSRYPQRLLSSGCLIERRMCEDQGVTSECTHKNRKPIQHMTQITKQCHEKTIGPGKKLPQIL